MKATSKEKILKSIREALIHSSRNPIPSVDVESTIYAIPADTDSHDLAILFATEFVKVNGNFLFCSNEEEFIQNLNVLTYTKGWKHLYCWEEPLQMVLHRRDFRKCRIGKIIDRADAGLTLCEALIARTGSVLISSRQGAGRALSIFPPVHITVGYTSQLVYDIKDGLKRIVEKYGSRFPSMVSLITGPSRTADIEKTLVLGAHGPKEVYVFLIDE